MPDRQPSTAGEQLMDDQRPIVFIHIPKTAGTSFISLLRGIFGRERVRRITEVNHSTRDEIRAMLTQEDVKPACIAAHITLEILKQSEGLYRPFTFLRHPVERVLSLYRFLQKQPESEQRSLGLEPGFSFDDFINTRTASLFIQVNDGMTRALAGEVTAINPQQSDFWDTTPNSRLLEKAVAFLDRSCFGVTEDMDGSMRIIQSEWGLPYTPEIARENTTTATAVVEPGMVLQIIEKNRMDLALHHYAVSLFKQRLSTLDECNRTPADSTSRFRPRPDETHPWPELFGTQGFHTEEGGSFGWIRAGQAGRIYFELPPGNIRLRIVCYAIRPSYAAGESVIRLNGEEVEATCKHEHDAWFTIETGSLQLNQDANVVSIEPPYFIPVKFIEPNSVDQRSLGLAVASITFCSTD